MPPPATTTAWADEAELADRRRSGVQTPRGRSQALQDVPGDAYAGVVDLQPGDPVPRPDPHPLGVQHRVRRTAPTTPGPVPQVMWNRGTELP